MKQNKNTLSGWAIPGWKPLAVQIKDWFDSFWHKDEKLPMDSIDGLQQVLNDLPSNQTLQNIMSQIAGDNKVFNGNEAYNVAAGLIVEKILIVPEVDFELSIGNTANDEDILPSSPVPAEGMIIVLEKYFKQDTNIFFNGCPPNTQAIIFLRAGL